MLTPRKVSNCKVCSSAAVREGSLGIPPALGFVFAPRLPAPVLWPHWARASGCRAFSSFPQHKYQRLSGPTESKSTKKMWKVPVLLLVLGSSWLWDPAEGASTVRPEDDITPGAEDSMVTLGAEDNVMTAGTSEGPYESGLTALVPINAESVTNFHLKEDGPTQESTVHAREESQSTTTLNAVTSHSIEIVGEDTETTVEKDGLATVTLVGIIVGVLLAIGFIGGIIIVVARKMSGRYSP